MLSHFFAKIKGRIKLFFSQFYKVPYCVPAWGWAEHWAILKCLLTGHLIDGNEKERLFDMIKRKTGAKYVFGFNSGQEAIHAALKARGVGPDDKVIMPSYCCETVARAVQDTGAHLLFCDINDDYNPDIDHILTLLDPSVRAVIVPHLFGNPADIDKFEMALEERGIRSKIFIIDDAAQSFGARLHGRLVGTFGDAGIISFGPGKTMTATGGGILITNSKDLSEGLGRINPSQVDLLSKLKRLAYWIIFRRWRRLTFPLYPFIKRFLAKGDHKEEKLMGLCNVDGAIGIEQLRKLDSLIKVRISRKKSLDDRFNLFYSRLFALLPSNDNSGEFLNVATKYLVRLNNNNDAQCEQGLYKQYLANAGIEIQDLYIPLHLNPKYFKEKVFLLKAETLYKQVLQIPLEPSINSVDFIYIIQKFEDFARNFVVGAR